MSPALLAVASGGFIAMEGVSYATHRWIMHGPGMRWHRSHHVPAQGRFEKNDLFPVFFSTIGFLVFLSASLTATTWLYWLGAGITGYGLVYMLVHEVYIHRRLPCPINDRAALDWMRDSHEIHHLYGGEPYGMLLPVVTGDLRRRAAAHRQPPAVPASGTPRRDKMRRSHTRL